MHCQHCGATWTVDDSQVEPEVSCPRCHHELASIQSKGPRSHAPVGLPTWGYLPVGAMVLAALFFHLQWRSAINTSLRRVWQTATLEELPPGSVKVMDWFPTKALRAASNSLSKVILLPDQDESAGKVFVVARLEISAALMGLTKVDQLVDPTNPSAGSHQVWIVPWNSAWYRLLGPDLSGIRALGLSATEPSPAFAQVDQISLAMGSEPERLAIDVFWKVDQRLVNTGAMTLKFKNYTPIKLVN